MPPKLHGLARPSEQFPAGSDPEKSLPPYTLEFVDIGSLTPEQSEYWHIVGFDFLVALDEEKAYLPRFGEQKPREKDGNIDFEKLDKVVDRFLDSKKKTPQYMIAIMNEETGEMMGAASMFDYTEYAPFCADVAFTIDEPFQGKKLGKRLIEKTTELLIANGFSHMFGYFETEAANKGAFTTILGDPIAGNKMHGYFWRIASELTNDQAKTEDAIKAFFATQHNETKESENEGDHTDRSNRKFLEKFKPFLGGYLAGLRMAASKESVNES